MNNDRSHPFMVAVRDVLRSLVRTHKIALIALVLAVLALSLAGWGEIDIQGMRQANAENMEKVLGAMVQIKGVVLEQGTQLENLGGKLDSLKVELSQVALLNLAQEYDLCYLRQGNTLPQGYLGVELAVDLPERRGIVIKKVHRNCPAEAAGLEEGDIILSYNGEKVWSENLLINDIMRTRPLTPVDINVLRGEEIKTFMVILVARR